MRVSNTSHRLRQLMEERGLKQVDILRAAEPYCIRHGVKLGRNDLSQYVNGVAEPGQRKLTVLSLALGVSEVWLMGYDVPPTPQPGSEPNEHKTAPPPLPAGAFAYNPTKRIPLLGRIAAGLPIYAEQNIEGWVWTDRNHGGEYFALRVRGDSMNAANIKDGDIVIVRQQDTVEESEIAVVLVDDGATIKRVRRMGDTVVLIPQSTDPAYQAQFYAVNEHVIRILGRVVECRTEF